MPPVEGLVLDVTGALPKAVESETARGASRAGRVGGGILEDAGEGRVCVRMLVVEDWYSSAGGTSIGPCSVLTRVLGVPEAVALEEAAGGDASPRIVCD